MSPKSFALSVKAVVRDGQRRCLTLRRSAPSKNNAGKWDFPGGKVDVGESFDVALTREIEEETGLSVELVGMLGTAQSAMPDRIVIYLMMEARPAGGDVRLSSEHDDHAWMTARELASADLCPQFRPFVESLAANER